MIEAEGVQSLDIQELIHACQTRGIRVYGMSPSRLRSELSQWLELNLVHQIPAGILILSRASVMTDKAPTATADTGINSEALKAALSSLPEELVDETVARAVEGTDLESPEKKLEVLTQQEHLIAEENEQEKVIAKRNNATYAFLLLFSKKKERFYSISYDAINSLHE